MMLKACCHPFILHVYLLSYCFCDRLNRLLNTENYNIITLPGGSESIRDTLETWFNRAEVD